MRFRYPIYYPILIGFAIIFCGLVSINLFLEGPNYGLALGLGIASVISLLEFYDITQSIWIDENGIIKDSLFGEVQRFSWSEIVGIKPSGLFSPGVNITNQTGDKISISSMLNGYNTIIKLISDYSNVLWDKKGSLDSSSDRNQTTSSENFDIEYTALSWRWISVPLLFVLSFGVLYASLKTETTIYIIFGSLFPVVVFPGYLYTYFREPVIVATKNEKLFIRFRSEKLRKPILKNAQEIRNINFMHWRAITSHGAMHPSTNLEIELNDGRKVKVENLSVSNEQIYMQLSSWLIKFRNMNNGKYE